VADVDDGFAAFYAERLWLLLPAVYRTADTDSFDSPGPLRELVNRIGAQVAVVRRSMDRMWDDQSIETCDDWVIPYLGDLLGTNLVSNLDARSQRLDVAKTIHYRRRKGTPELLEELAHDVTGWTAHVVEGFRQLGRTRHGLDPAVGPDAFPQASPADVAQLLRIEGLTGLLTGTPAGGLADLRSAHGAALAGTAFGESFRTADFRAGRGAVGHAGIGQVLVFLWRLASFPVRAGTPVAVAGCPGQYVFDPTGRQVPLFLPAPPAPADFAEAWTPDREWQVPGPLTSSLEAALTAGPAAVPPSPPYPDTDVPPRYALSEGWSPTAVWPELGRFAADSSDPSSSPPGPLTVDYQYGFSSLIGAGPYDRGQLGSRPDTAGEETVVSGGHGLDAALVAAGPTGTVTIGDSLTSPTLADVGSTAAPIASLLVRAGPAERPVLRPPPGTAGPGEWVLTGSPGAQLVLDGLTVSGCDIVLRGAFDTVWLTACTVDPGTARPADPDPASSSPPGSPPAGSASAGSGPPLAPAADGTLLAPCRIFVEADPAAPAGQPGGIGQLLVDHCILGPVRTRLGGSVQTLTVTDSIVQGLRATTGPAFAAADIFDPALLARGLAAGDAAPGQPVDPLSAALLAAMPEADAAAILAYAAARPGSGSPPAPAAAGGASAAWFPLGGLNALVGSAVSLYQPELFGAVSLSPAVLALVKLAQTGTLAPDRLAALNRALLEEAFPVALAVAALAVADAAVQLTRVTVLGRTAVHRLSASDSVLAGFASADDVQDGCVRFSAYPDGSAVPRQYQAATIEPGTPIFTSVSYGQPGYAQLTETADAAITGGAAGASIASGAENGSEMGAFCADLNPVREQGLLTKYAEYLPLGLTPVIIHVT
jgi:hypothetical protein